jgi:hypothetical protein
MTRARERLSSFDNAYSNLELDSLAPPWLPAFSLSVVSTRLLVLETWPMSLSGAYGI